MTENSEPDSNYGRKFCLSFIKDLIRKEIWKPEVRKRGFKPRPVTSMSHLIRLTSLDSKNHIRWYKLF